MWPAQKTTDHFRDSDGFGMFNSMVQSDVDKVDPCKNQGE
jgi:hypothetical protein